jgi:Xaa-Pro aminopeptidase
MHQNTVLSVLSEKELFELIGKIATELNLSSSYIVISNNEYYSDENRLGYLINFHGSAGICYFEVEKFKLVRVTLFVDGRYTEEAAKLSNESSILSVKNISNHFDWLKSHFIHDTKILLDMNIYSNKFVESLKSVNQNKNIHHFDRSIINSSWQDKFDYCTNNNQELVFIPISIAEKTFEEKIQKIQQTYLDHKNNDIHSEIYVIDDDQTIAWLLNARKVNENPGIKGILVLVKVDSEKNSPFSQILFTNEKEKFSQSNIYNSLNFIQIEKFQEYMKNHLSQNSQNPNSKIKIDTKNSNANLINFLKTSGYEIIHTENIFEIEKAIKTTSEIKHIKDAHIIDGATLTKFIFYLQQNKSQISEIDAAKKLLEIKQQNKEFMCQSFDTILCTNENSSKIHGKPSQKILGNFYLLDAGGHYFYGTTDITRTVSRDNSTESQKFHYTLVLKGHIELAKSIFKKGTTGANLEILARKYLWKHGIDYNHSTGHGVGGFLNVHEGPQGISMRNHQPLMEGMILSNEPGCYFENEYGIRIENLMIVKQSKFEGYLEFETISLAPFCHTLIDWKMLATEEIKWIREYYEKIRKSITHLLNEKERIWLENELNIIEYS